MNGYESDLKNCIEEAEAILKEAKIRLKDLYDDHDLAWTDVTLRGLKGDVYAKILGKYLEEKTGIKTEYEVDMCKGTRMKADILFKGVEIESKLQSYYDIDSDRKSSLKSRWERTNKECPKLAHLVVVWNQHPKMAKRIREIIGKEHHFMLRDISTS